MFYVQVGRPLSHPAKSLSVKTTFSVTSETKAILAKGVGLALMRGLQIFLSMKAIGRAGNYGPASSIYSTRRSHPEHPRPFRGVQRVKALPRSCILLECLPALGTSVLPAEDLAISVQTRQNETSPSSASWAKKRCAVTPFLQHHLLFPSVCVSQLHIRLGPGTRCDPDALCITHLFD